MDDERRIVVFFVAERVLGRHGPDHLL